MDINFEITKKQKMFIEATQDEVLYGGAAGGGKSFAQLIDAFLYAVKYKNSKQLILRRTFPELERSLILNSLTMYPQNLTTYNTSKHIWKFRNGSIIEFGYCERESDVTKYQSAEYDVIRFDELTHFSEFQYLYLKSRLRGANPYPKQLKSTTNPGSVGHMWVKQRFIDVAAPLEVYTDEHNETRIFIPAKVEENRFLMQADPNYIKRLEQLPENQKKALLHGDWNIFEGQFFSEFRYDLHVVEPFKIPEEWKKIRGIDWGYNDPCAVYWAAIAPDGHIYIYKELYVNQTLASDVAKKIVEMSKDENIEYTVMSPDAWQKRGIKDIDGESIAEIFAKNGVPAIQADNSRIIGWQQMHEFLATAPDGKPFMQIFSNCRNLIRTLPAAIFSETNPEDISDKCEDHAIEAVRYILMSRPKPKIIREKPLIPKFDPFSVPKKLKKDFLRM